MIFEFSKPKKYLMFSGQSFGIIDVPPAVPVTKSVPVPNVKLDLSLRLGVRIWGELKDQNLSKYISPYHFPDNSTAFFPNQRRFESSCFFDSRNENTVGYCLISFSDIILNSLFTTSYGKISDLADLVGEYLRISLPLRIGTRIGFAPEKSFFFSLSIMKNRSDPVWTPVPNLLTTCSKEIPIDSIFLKMLLSFWFSKYHPFSSMNAKSILYSSFTLRFTSTFE